MSCHMIQFVAKSRNSNFRDVLYGQGFDYVTCANYMWEILSWISLSMFIGHIGIFVYTFMESIVMIVSAVFKHKRMKREFNYPRNRKAIIPYIL